MQVSSEVVRPVASSVSVQIVGVLQVVVVVVGTVELSVVVDVAEVVEQLVLIDLVGVEAVELQEGEGSALATLGADERMPFTERE